MRPIKFRGKRIDTNEWVYGYPVKVVSSCGSGWNMHVPPADPDDYHKVYPIKKPIEQYTGLKDSNGVDIYEGDLIEFGHDGEKETREVKYYGYMGYPAFDLVTPQNAKYYFDGNALSYISEYEEYPCYVVGNIYDDPELLDS